MTPRKRLAVLAVLAAAACSDSTGPEPGTTTMLGGGTLQTFIERGPGGAPTALGVTFDSALLAGLPLTDTFMTVKLPSAAGGTVYTHLYFDYVPHGHEPAGVYDTAHFDFHFYFIPPDLRELIPAGVDTFTVPAAIRPANFRKATESVSRMGTHWADSTGPEFTGGGWNRSMIYGYNEGQFKFYDIMITKHWLQTTPTDTVTFNQPASFPASGYYPTKFTVRYDAATKRFRVAMEGFVQR